MTARRTFVIGLVAAATLAVPVGSLRAERQSPEEIQRMVEEMRLRQEVGGIARQLLVAHDPAIGALSDCNQYVRGATGVPRLAKQAAEACAEDKARVASGHPEIQTVVLKCWAHLDTAIETLSEADDVFEQARRTPAPAQGRLVQQGQQLQRRGRDALEQCDECMGGARDLATRIGQALERVLQSGVSLIEWTRATGGIGRVTGGPVNPAPGPGTSAGPVGGPFTQPGSAQPGVGDPADSGGIRAEEILTPEGRRLLFQLGAEMNTIAQRDAPTDAFGEFVTGLAEWASATLELLARKPGEPVEDMARGIIDYLTTDNAENHRLLRAAAEQALREFQANPARFLGRTLPDLLPLPGGAAGKTRALQRIAEVEKAATRIQEVATVEKKLAAFAEKVGPPTTRFGTQAPGDMCFALNSCVDQALAEAQLFKTGGPIGDGTPWKIVGTRGLQSPRFPRPVDPQSGLLDFSHTPEQIYEKLQPHGEGFAPRRAGSYTPEQLDLIWNGRPISVEGPEEIARILQREGPGSQGLVIVERTRPINVPEGGVFGHVLNAQNGNGLVDFVDRTHMLGNVSEIQNWFFFPIQ